MVVTALTLASGSSHMAVVKALPGAGAATNRPADERWKPLSGQGDIVSTLHVAGHRREDQRKGGRTPLNAAAAENHVQVVQTLLKAGANMKLKSHEGQTPSNSAAGKRRIEDDNQEPVSSAKRKRAKHQAIVA